MPIFLKLRLAQHHITENLVESFKVGFSRYERATFVVLELRNTKFQRVHVAMKYNVDP